MKCLECGKTPSEINEYIEAAEADYTTPEEYVRSEEGTFNPDTNKFWCTECYIAIGMPLGIAK